VVLNAVRWQQFDRPALGWAVVGALVVWSVVVTGLYASPRTRRLPVMVADLAIGCAAVLVTPLVQPAEMVAGNASTLPTFWVMSPVLAWAAYKGLSGGLAAAGIMSLCDLSIRGTPSGANWGNIFLLLLAGGVIGWSTQLLREAVEGRAQAERSAAAMRERARLARAVHDGVLQVLALVQRRGAEIGGETAELARLAGEQEVSLRRLVQGLAGGGGTAAVEGAGTGGSAGSTGSASQANLVAALTGLASATTTVSGPAGRVLLPADVVDELAAAVRACLDNVARHVGEDAPAWVLVEDLGAVVAVTVRDEGPGIPAGRLEAARTEGRLGVRESVCGRLEQLGGSATLVTAPGQGVEWELCVPRE
jgi:signal transduction histidine kinase